MKTVAYLICLLMLLLNGVPPSDASSYGTTASGHPFLHFEKDKQHYPERTLHFQLVVTDETQDNADSESEDADPFSFEVKASAPWYHSHAFDNIQLSRAYALYARSGAPFITKGIQKYLEQRVLRI